MGSPSWRSQTNLQILYSNESGIILSAAKNPEGDGGVDDARIAITVKIPWFTPARSPQCGAPAACNASVRACCKRSRNSGSSFAFSPSTPEEPLPCPCALFVR